MTTFSNKIKVSNFTLKSVEPAYSNQTWTGQRIIRSTGIQYYKLNFTLNFNIKDRAEVDNFLALYSQGKSFQLPLGHLSTYQGIQTGGLVASTAAAKGSRVITATNTMGVGELLQFTNHKKIYRIIDRTATSLTLFPALQNTVQATETIFYNNLVIEAVLDPDNDYSMNIENVTSIQLKAMENVQ
ncbi:hypothetical protein AB6866_04795 [Rahnella inusitata]|uniref:hypothetical protein n=1 Tax=Rahnella inusitata TaxID=58169 RepID=UPI0039BDE3BC